MPFRWTINPYRGCEFGCKYCYARYTHEFMERRDPLAFEREIYAKVWDPGLFRRELRKVRGDDAIAIGTATDPYQPAERRYAVTRSLLEVFAGAGGYRLGITTKSDLIARDADLFAAVAARNSVHIAVTVTTMDENLARLTEPFAPRPDLRIRAVRALADAGMDVGVYASPILPGLTDSEASLTAVASAAKSAGAKRFGANVLFLQPCAQRIYFPFLQEQFPHLLATHRRYFANGAYMKDEYATRMYVMVASLRTELGLDGRESVPLRELPRGKQLLLF